MINFICRTGPQSAVPVEFIVKDDNFKNMDLQCIMLQVRILRVHRELPSLQTLTNCPRHMRAGKPVVFCRGQILNFQQSTLTTFMTAQPHGEGNLRFFTTLSFPCDNMCVPEPGKENMT